MRLFISVMLVCHFFSIIYSKDGSAACADAITCSCARCEAVRVVIARQCHAALRLMRRDVSSPAPRERAAA